METTDNKYCNKCDHRVQKSELEDYSYQCIECDEDLYIFETHSKTINNKPEPQAIEAICQRIENGYSDGENWELDIDVSVWENLKDEELKDITKQIRNGEVSNYFDPCGWTLYVYDSRQ